jgi:hypothetical protein
MTRLTILILCLLSLPAAAEPTPIEWLRYGFNIITGTTEPQVKRGLHGGCTNGCDPVKPTGGK